MTEHELRQQLANLATAAVPESGTAPPQILRRASRGQRRTVLMATGVATCILMAGLYAVGATRNLVGPAPIAGGPDQGVVDPPDRAGGTGYGLNAEVIHGRICASFDFEYYDGEEHRAATQICDPDPTARMSVETKFLDVDNAMEPSGLVVIAAGVGFEVARVEVDLPGRLFPMQEMPILDFEDHPRRVAASALGRELFLDKKGRFDAVIRAFDAAGNLIVEQRLCDPAQESNTC